MPRFKLSDPCEFCGSKDSDFRSLVSQKEKQISGMCQRCQDNFFREYAPDFGLFAQQEFRPPVGGK